VRMQAVHNVQDGNLRFSLLDMKEGGNGVYTIPAMLGWLLW